MVDDQCMTMRSEIREGVAGDLRLAGEVVGREEEVEVEDFVSPKAQSGMTWLTPFGKLEAPVSCNWK